MNPLKKELEQRRKQIVSLKEEMKTRDQKILEVEHKNAKLEEENRHAETALQNIDAIIQQKSQLAAEYEKEKHVETIQSLQRENTSLKQKIRQLEFDSQALANKQAEIEFLYNKISEISSSYSSKEALEDLRGLRNENIQLRKEADRKAKEISHNWSYLEDIVQENKVLREMAGVPENYGFDFKEIKLLDAQKIEEYKGIIRRMDEEIKELEKDRTNLRYRLRQMSAFSKAKLTDSQVLMVEEFARNLEEGKVELPLDNRSKELLQEIEKLSAQVEVLKRATAGGVSDTVMEQVRKESQEVKELLLKLHSGNQVDKAQEETISRHLLQLPPIPIPDENGDFNSGHSYRFNSKLGVIQIYTGESSRDLSALQLQIVELVTLLNRREEDEKNTQYEIEEFRNKLAQILLVQQELFEQYASEKLSKEQEIQEMAANHDQTLQELRETRAQLTVLQNSNPSELTKQMALLEVNYMRLMRKYTSLESEEREIRQAYHNIEATHSEKDLNLMQKIGKLREWRVKATLQLQFVFKQLRKSVPVEKFETISSQLEILKAKQADWVIRESELHARIARSENSERENLELKDEVKKEQESKLEIENELEIVSQRLEMIDAVFKQEQSLLRRIARYLKAKFINVEDLLKERSMTKDAFKSALSKIGIKFSIHEMNILLRIAGVDSAGLVSSSELLRRLRVLGIKPPSEEIRILEIIYDGIKRGGFDLRSVFEIFDSDGNNEISTDEMRRSLKNLEIGLSDMQIDKVIALIDLNSDGNICFEEFAKVFERRLDLEVHSSNPEETLAKIQNAIETAGLDLIQAFSIFDVDRDGRLSRFEFIDAINRLNLSVTHEDIIELWNKIQKDGEITYADFAEVLRSDAHPIQVDNRQLLISEAKEQAALAKAERFKLRMNTVENNLRETEKQFAKKEEQYFELMRLYHLSKEEISVLKTRLSNTLSRSESEKIRQTNEMLTSEIAEVRMALNTYKSLVGVSSDHVKTLKLQLEKRRDEVETFQTAIREVQAENPDAVQIGTLFHSVMISRWAEATANKKYDSLLEETRMLRSENFRLETSLSAKESALLSIQQVLTEKVRSYEELLKDLNLKSVGFISVEKSEELIKQIRSLSGVKADLEDKNRVLHLRIQTLENSHEEAMITKLSVDNLFEYLKNTYTDELSTKVIELTQRINKLRLDELEAKREMHASKQQEQYLLKVHDQDLQTIKELEHEVARWETLLNTKEDTWRKKDNERQKLLLNPQVKAPTLPIEDPRYKDTLNELNKTKRKVQILQEKLKERSTAPPETNVSGISPQEIVAIDTEEKAKVFISQVNSRMAHLQEMLQGKIHQVDAMEYTVNNLQDTLERTKNQASVEIQRLVQGIQNVQESKGYRPEVEASLNNKDKKITTMKAQTASAHKAREQLENTVKQLKEELEKAKYELSLEKSKTNTKKDSEPTLKKLAAKDRELAKLKHTIANLKEDLLRQAEAGEKHAQKTSTIIKKEPINKELQEENRLLRIQLEESKTVKKPEKREESDSKALKLTINRLETENKRLNDELILVRPLSLEEENALQKVPPNFSALFEGKQVISEKTLIRALVHLPSEDQKTIARTLLTYASVSINKKNGDIVRGISVELAEIFINKSVKKPADISLESHKTEKKVDILYKQVHEQKRELEIHTNTIHRLESYVRKLESEKEAMVNMQEPTTVTYNYNVENIEPLREEIFELQEKNYHLEKAVKEISHESGAFKEENAVLGYKLNKIHKESVHLQQIVDNLRENRLKSLEGVLDDENKLNLNRIQKLEDEINEFTMREIQLRQLSMKLQQENITMAFEYDHHHLTVNRFNRRIRELEEFKQAFYNKNPVEQDKTQKFIHEITPQTTENATTNSEFTLESLKRLIEKLRFENESLRNTNHEFKLQKQKLQGEGELMKQLEQANKEIWEMRTRENINKDLEHNMKKVNKANEMLRRDMEREIKQVEEAENRYRKLLLQHEQLLSDYNLLKSSYY